MTSKKRPLRHDPPIFHRNQFSEILRNVSTAQATGVITTRVEFASLSDVQTQLDTLVTSQDFVQLTGHVRPDIADKIIGCGVVIEH